MSERAWWQRVDGLPPRAARARATWRPISTTEWAVIIAAAIGMLAVNKLIIEDPRSAWFTVIYWGGLLGLGCVLVSRWLRGRLRRSSAG